MITKDKKKFLQALDELLAARSIYSIKYTENELKPCCGPTDKQVLVLLKKLERSFEKFLKISGCSMEEFENAFDEDEDNLDSGEVQ